MNDDNLDTWLTQPVPPVESIACFHGAHDDCRTADCPCEHHRQQLTREEATELLRDIRQDGHYASLTTIRAAIADVLDTGYQCDRTNGLSRGELTECNLFHPWRFTFHEPETDEENLQRERFIDAVTQRITRLQSPPHNLDAGLRERLAQTGKGGNDR